MDALQAELNERAEAANSLYSATGHSSKRVCFVPVTKNHQKYRSRCLVHEIFLTNIFIIVTEQPYQRKIILAASVLYGCGYLLLL